MSPSHKHQTNSKGYVVPIVILFVAVVATNWVYTTHVKPPDTTVCGSPGGPPVTARRIRLRDGRFLAYAESGVKKEMAKHKIIFVHGFLGSRLDTLRASNEIMQELGCYMVGYDRAGYGESDPNPTRSVKSEAMDIEELADKLQLGSRFYLIGYSLGGHALWGSLKYIPGRLAGVAMLAPVVNYRWPSFPNNLSTKAYLEQDVGDQWALRVVYYAPWLLNWWLTQSWLPTSTVIRGTTALPNRFDAHLRSQARFDKLKKRAIKQGIHESLHRDMLVMFGKWAFDPMDLLPVSVPVHLWQGDEDGLVPVSLQRHICSRLKWIEYHELSETGHYLTAIPGFGDLVLKTLLLDS